MGTIDKYGRYRQGPTPQQWALGVLSLAALLFFMLSVQGCTGAPADSKANATVYELDIYGTLDGVPFDGIAMGSNAKTHTIKIESKTDVNEMVIQSNARYLHFPDAIQTGWFKASRGFLYSYSEVPGIEDTGYSVLRLSAFSKEIKSDGSPVGAAYGLVLFHSEKFSLAGENICNTADGQTRGASICQNREGLTARLRFKTQVVVARPKSDGTGPVANQCQGTFVDAYTWQYQLPLGECVIEFMQTAKPHDKYVHLAYGHNRSQYRGL